MLTIEQAQEVAAGMIPANYYLNVFMDSTVGQYDDLPMALNERGAIRLLDRNDITYAAPYPGAGSTFGHAFQVIANGPASAPTLVKDMDNAGCIYDYLADGWGAPNYCANFAFQVLVDGVYYKIPDIWMGVYNSYAGLFSNWKTHNMIGLGCNSSPVEVYGWRDGNPKDPVILLLSAPNRTINAVSYAFITIKYLRDIKSEMPEDAFDQFNYRLARKKLEDKSFNPRVLLKTHATDMPKALTVTPVLDSWNKAKFEAIRLEVDPETTIANGSPEYAQVAVLTNDTDAPMTFKTADFSWQIQDQFTFKWTNSEKAATAASYKSTTKGGLDVFGLTKAEVAFEFTISANFEYTHSEENTQTHTETKTFTVSGQSVVVPPHTTYIAEAQWRRARITGYANIYYPITDALSVMVRFTDELSIVKGSTFISAELNMDKVASELGLDIIKMANTKNAKGEDRPVPCVVGRYPFDCTTSSLATYGVRPSK